jgi:hypothetical protein
MLSEYNFLGKTENIEIQNKGKYRYDIERDSR